MISYSVITKDNSPVIVGSFGLDYPKTFELPYSQEAIGYLQGLRQRLDGVTNMTDALLIFTELENYLAQIPVLDYSGLTYGYVVKSNRTGKYHLCLNNKVVEALELPYKFILDLQHAFEKGLDMAPLVKFIILLSRRALFHPENFQIGPSEWMALQYNYISKTYVCPELYEKYVASGFNNDIAASKATIRQTPFTNEGLLVMKKVVQPVDSMYRFEWDSSTNSVVARLRSGIVPVVDENTGVLAYQDNRMAEDLVFEPIVMGDRGDAFNCYGIPGHIVKVGTEIVLLSWSQVDCNPYNSCVKGLHVGNQDYIRSFEGPNSVTLNVLVSPLNIGTVAINQSEDVMRVKEYYTMSIKGAPERNKYLYHPTNYAQSSEAQWTELLSEFISELNDKLMGEKNKIDTVVKSINFLHS